MKKTKKWGKEDKDEEEKDIERIIGEQEDNEGIKRKKWRRRKG